MFRFLTGLFLSWVLIQNAHAVDGQELPDIKPGIATITTIEPERSVGYTVGDVLTRQVIISIKKPYALVKESLPIVGYEKRYKGQVIGIDLSNIQHTEKDTGDAVKHTLTLSYQVWTNNVVAKPAALPAEYLRIINTQSKDKETTKLRIPSWNFAVSPISVFGQVKVESDMSGFRGPLLLDASSEKARLNWLLGIIGLSLLGLLYILGKHAWLPRMGGPFAQAFRLLRKAPDTPEGLKQAVAAVHQSLNKTAGNSVFTDNLDMFLAQKPTYASIKTEIEQFFALSRQVFFEPNASHGIDKPLIWLQQFVRRCRDCERGLTPDARK